MHPAIQAFRGLGVDMALPHQAAESGLDMRARAAEPVVKVEVAEGGIEIVAPQQADHPAAEPDAFRVAGRPGEQARRFGDLVDASSGLPWRCRRPVSAARAAWGSPLWANAAVAVKLKAATQNAARNTTQQGDYRHCPAGFDGGRPPAIRSAMRPDWDAITAFLPAAPAMLALKHARSTRTAALDGISQQQDLAPTAQAFVQRLHAVCLRGGRSWQRQGARYKPFRWLFNPAGTGSSRCALV